MAKLTFTEGNWRKNPWFRNLCTALCACKSETDVANLLRDVATLSELKAMADRLEMARQLSIGVPQREIAASVGGSTATVARVALFLKSGLGYKNALETLQHHHANSSRRKKTASVN